MSGPGEEPSQTDQILMLLSDGQWHDTTQLHAIGWRYTSRLHDLRKRGYVLEKRRTADRRIEEWRLVATPGGRIPGGGRPEPHEPPRRSQPRPCASGNARLVKPESPQPEQRSLL
jgi:hypothetical protein